MKNTILFIAAMLLVFCIVPIATTQAMPRRTQEKDSFASTQPNAALYVLNQKELPGMITELGNPAFKDNVLTRGSKCPQGTTIAQSGKSTTTTTKGKTNPHVKRSGHGRSTMGDNVTKKDDGDENEENEVYGDDSAVEYNKGLRNSAAGYNEDL
jgi:hypothetical protein